MRELLVYVYFYFCCIRISIRILSLLWRKRHIKRMDFKVLKMFILFIYRWVYCIRISRLPQSLTKLVDRLLTIHIGIYLYTRRHTLLGYCTLLKCGRWLCCTFLLECVHSMDSYRNRWRVDHQANALTASAAGTARLRCVLRRPVHLAFVSRWTGNKQNAWLFGGWPVVLSTSVVFNVEPVTDSVASRIHYLRDKFG